MSKRPLYLCLYEQLVSDIQSGKLKPGHRINTQKELAEQNNVSEITSKKALEMLAEAGFIERIPGRGSFVCQLDENADDGFVRDNLLKGSLIGLVMSGMSEIFGVQFMRGVHDEAFKHGCCITLRTSYNSQEMEAKVIEQLSAFNVKGLIIMPIHGMTYNVEILKHAIEGFPLVLADRHLKGLSVPFVGSNNFKSSYNAVEYLFSLGHHEICFVSSKVSTSAIEERMNGFVKAYAENEASLNKMFLFTDITCTIPGFQISEQIREDIEKIKDYFKNNPHITAVVASDYNIVRLVHRTLNELGLRVPQDVSLVCFDAPDDPLAEQFYTHVRQREYEMGTTAFRLLVDLFQGKSCTESVILDTDFVVCKSTKAVENR